MSDLLKVAIPALSALCGVIVGLAVGFYQWKVERKEVKISEYLRKRRESYKDFYDKLESTHLELRLSDVSYKDFGLFIMDVNSHLIMNEIYMDKVDRELANQYLSNLFKLKESIKQSNDENTKRDWQQTCLKTNSANYLELEVEAIREKIIARVRKILKT